VVFIVQEPNEEKRAEGSPFVSEITSAVYQDLFGAIQHSATFFPKLVAVINKHISSAESVIIILCSTETNCSYFWLNPEFLFFVGWHIQESY
jgi:hypothetical protein